jgi:hypothetical protein
LSKHGRSLAARHRVARSGDAGRAHQADLPAHGRDVTGRDAGALRHDDDLDDSTKGTIAEIANDRNFLLAVEDYVRRTRLVH